MGCPPAAASRKTPNGAGEGVFAGLHGGWGLSTHPSLVRGQPSSTISSLWPTQPWGSQCPRSRWPTRGQGTEPSLQEAGQEDPRRQRGGQGPRRNGPCHTVACNHLPSTRCEKAARPGQSVAGGRVSPGAAPQPEAHITDPLTAWRPGVQDQVSAGLAPHGGSEGESVPWLCPSVRWLLAVLGTPSWQMPHSRLCLIGTWPLPT